MQATIVYDSLERGERERTRSWAAELIGGRLATPAEYGRRTAS